MPHSANSSISSIPPDFELEDSSSPSATPPATDATSQSFITTISCSDAVPSSRPQAQSLPSAVDPVLLSTLVAAVQQERRPTTSTGANTDNDLAVNQFSPDLIRVVSQSDGFLTKLQHAISGFDADRQAMGSYWRSLWRDLHVTADQCVFLDHRIVLPDSLRTPFLSFLHATHAGAKAMLEMASYVWFPHMYKAIQSLAKHCPS